MGYLKLKHYYHMYADGRWQEPFNEHITALTDSGLLDNLDFIGVGITGSESNRDKLKQVLPSNFQIVSEAKSGWEQVTHTPLSKDTQEPAKILYAHTKGAANNRHSQASWRREMTKGVVYHWRECVNLLNNYDVVGCRWKRDPWRHYSGTFWWATSDYISNLAPISYVYRDDAEAWIGQSLVGGTHVEITPTGQVTTVHSFGRIFVSGKTISGKTLTNFGSGQFLPGDEFIGLSSLEANKLIRCILKTGMTYFIRGSTIIVR